MVKTELSQVGRQISAVYCSPVYRFEPVYCFLKQELTQLELLSVCLFIKVLLFQLAIADPRLISEQQSCVTVNQIVDGDPNCFRGT